MKATPEQQPRINPNFSPRLLEWHQQFGRKDLPWQVGHDAYGIWVSEIMLQQTQVQTVIPYYQRFMQRFPSIQALAQAAEDEVLHHWSGLGYYARARNLHRAAQLIENDYDGRFPDNFDAVLKLPGIGRSTAGAILAFAFQQRHPILDGNVKRVLCRFYGVMGFPGKKDIESQLWRVADQHTPDHSVERYTQAIMDLGATCCTRSKPNCHSCPQQADCYAFREQLTAELPHRKPRAAERRRESVLMLVIRDHAGRLCLIKRPATGIWGGLHCFPEFTDLNATKHWIAQHIATPPAYRSAKQTIKHSFTHFDLCIQPLYLSLDHSAQLALPDALWYDQTNPVNLGLPKPVTTIINSI